MSVLNWGGPSKFEKTESTSGAPATGATWTDIDTPKDGTIKLTTTAGAETVALEEGGGVVDVRYARNTYQLEFDLYLKKGVVMPFTNEDGVVAGEWAFRLTPEDPTTDGFLIERSVVRVEESYSTADGTIYHVVARALKPKTGATVKKYTGPAA